MVITADADEERLRAIWNQTEIPVVLRRTGAGERPRLRLHGTLDHYADPYSVRDRAWLKLGHSTDPTWVGDKKYWEIPKTWFNDFVARALKKYGRLYVIQPYREQEKCAPACWDAVGHECQCSCMGENHGAGQHGNWFVVSDTFATRHGEIHLACRLMTVKSQQGGLQCEAT